MNQDYLHVLKLADSLHEDELSKLLLFGIKCVTPTKVKALYKTNDKGSLTTKRDIRVQTITKCIENPQISKSSGNDSEVGHLNRLRSSLDKSTGLSTKEIGLCIDYHFTILAEPDAKKAFTRFLKHSSIESDAKSIAELKYLLMAFTSTKFRSTEDYGRIYNSIRNEHDWKYKVIVRGPLVGISTQQEYPRTKPNNGSMGLALIINIKKFQLVDISTSCFNIKLFDLEKDRKGSEYDVISLKRLFGQLDCDMWSVKDTCKEEWSTEDFQKHIRAFRDHCDDVKPKYIFVYIGSHGKEGYITTTDSKIDIYEDITDLFYERNQENPTGAKNLKGVPKILFINSCRVRDEYKPQSLNKFPTTENLVILRPQPEGLESYRHRLYGTWAVHCFVFVVMNLAYTKPFVELMKVVKKVFSGLDLWDTDRCVKYGQKFETTWVSSFDQNFRLEPIPRDNK